MATKTVVQPAGTAPKRGPGKRGNYYDPPKAIKTVPGVELKRGERSDFYTGTADALIASGLVTMDMLPGQPGRGISNIAYRPRGQTPVGGAGWSFVPGYMTIYRSVSGVFRVALVVSREERARREADREGKRLVQRVEFAAAHQDEREAAQRRRQALEGPKTEQEFREKMREGVEIYLNTIWYVLTTKPGEPFAFARVIRSNGRPARQ